MHSSEAARAVLAGSGMTQREASARLGKSPGYLGAMTSRGSDLGCSTLAGIADLCGYDLAIVRRSDGETIGTIDPPEREG